MTVATLDNLPDRIRYSEALAAAPLLPPAYRKQPANILLAQEYAAALDLPVMTVIQTVHIIDGKPTASAQLIGALVRRAGHRLRVVGDATHAVAEIVRCDDPEFSFRAEWTLDRARAAGIAGKGTWKAHPGAMLKARAITEVARDACPEALFGVAYTPEEMGAPVDTDGVPLTLAPAPVPAEQPDAGDAAEWEAAVDGAGSVDELRALWKGARHAHALTPELNARIDARLSALAVDVETGEIVEAELEAGS